MWFVNLLNIVLLVCYPLGIAAFLQLAFLRKRAAARVRSKQQGESGAVTSSSGAREPQITATGG